MEVLGVALFCAVVGLFIYMLVLSRQGWKEVHRKLGLKPGFSSVLDESAKGISHYAEGEIEGVAVKAWHEYRRTRGSEYGQTHSVIEMACVLPEGFKLELTRENIIQRRDNDITVGNADFDGGVIVQSTDRALALRLLQDSQVQSLVKIAVDAMAKHIVVADNKIRYDVHQGVRIGNYIEAVSAVVKLAKIWQRMLA
jgi:hypothetical protein